MKKLTLKDVCMVVATVAFVVFGGMGWYFTKSLVNSQVSLNHNAFSVLQDITEGHPGDRGLKLKVTVDEDITVRSGLLTEWKVKVTDG